MLSVISACRPLNGYLDEVTLTPSIPIQPRVITQATLSLHEIWRKEMLKIRRYVGSAYTPSPDIFVSQFDKLYIVSIDPVSDAVQILALSQKTGEQLWATKQMGYIDNFAASPAELFVASEDGIVAYDSSTGNLKWTSDQPPPDHQRFILSFNAPTLDLIIMDGIQNSYTTIDLQSGKVGDKHTAEAPWGLVKIDSQYRYMWLSETTLQLEDVNTNQSEQLTSLPQRPYTPLRSGNMLVIPYLSDRRSIFHSIIVLNLITKQKLWDCQECFASDVAIDDNKLYAINRDGMLVGYDRSTGKLLGTAEFSGGSKIDPSTTLYGVTALNGRVFLYFGDVQQIIALGP
jgi:outer membrane protein assembly factor BamB